MIELDERPDRKEMVRLSRMIASCWEDVANELGPVKHPQYRIDSIKKDYPGDTQAQSGTMLTEWSNRNGAEGTRRDIVVALLRAGQKSFADDVFSQELVKEVDKLKL